MIPFENLSIQKKHFNNGKRSWLPFQFDLFGITETWPLRVEAFPARVFRLGEMGPLYSSRCLTTKWPIIYSPENYHASWKSMVGRCIPYWNSPFLGDMLVFGGVWIISILSNYRNGPKSNTHHWHLDTPFASVVRSTCWERPKFATAILFHTSGWSPRSREPPLLQLFRWGTARGLEGWEGLDSCGKWVIPVAPT